MMKNVIKLNEQQFRQIVTDSVKRVLAESEFNEEDMEEGIFDFLGYGANRAGQKGRQMVQGVRDAVSRGVNNFQQGVNNARQYSQARDNQRAATKNQGKIQKYIETLNDMYNSGLFNGIAYGKKAMAEIQNLTTILKQVAGNYKGTATAWNNDANSTLNQQQA